MQELTAEGTQALNDLAVRYGISVAAVRTLLFAVASGNGTMAQFYHAELGGGGQWMRGGMTMVGDMFNHGLQAKVASLCTELASLLASRPVFAEVASDESQREPAHAHAHSTHGAWWPTGLGIPSATGGQNDTRYAYFPEARRLALWQNGRVAIHDTLDHRIGGVQQQQGGSSGSLSFTSQRGTFAVDSLPAVSEEAPAPAPTSPRSAGRPPHANERSEGEDVMAAIERLADLHKKNILSDDEFRIKKAELLGRL